MAKASSVKKSADSALKKAMANTPGRRKLSGFNAGVRKAATDINKALNRSAKKKAAAKKGAAKKTAKKGG
ncbi:MAG TPA: hypothetical protein PLY86_21290, partial [bacterium]|nr:hypothetical protein [bacterium]